jgi:hypothetical protein
MMFGHSRLPNANRSSRNTIGGFLSASGVLALFSPLLPVQSQELPRPVATVLNAARAPVSVAKAGWRLEIHSEETSDVFWDRDTIQTRTAPLFSLRVTNAANLSRAVALSWRILDQDGNVYQRRNARFTVSARGLLNRRELFEAPRRGAFVLHVEADTGASGKLEAALPFAIVVTPSTGFRPRSFFGLNAPAQLSRNQLDFYSRIGARVLRSPWMTHNSGEIAAFDEQMRARLERNLATVGVLLPEASTPSAANVTRVDSIGTDWQETRRSLTPIARHTLMARWEVGGIASPQERSELIQAVNAIRPGYANAVNSNAAAWWPGSPPFIGLPTGLTFVLPQARSLKPTTSDVVTLLHPAAQSRVLSEWNRQAGAQNQPFYLDDACASASGDLRRATGQWVSRYALAIMNGASGLSTALDGSACGSGAKTDVMTRMTRATAFAQMTRTLEDTAYSGELFASSPGVWGALFRGPKSNVALVWASPETAGSRLVLRFDRTLLSNGTPLRFLDAYGNELLRSRDSRIRVPLREEPIYIEFPFDVESFQAAARSATVEDTSSLAVQLLPLTQIPGSDLLTVRVKVQNLLPQAWSGSLRLTPPTGWKLASDVANLKLAIGQYRTIGFVVTQSQRSATGQYAFQMNPSGQRSQEQSTFVATALNWTAGQTVRIDGSLAEWQQALWLSPSGDAGNVPARIAVRWDATRLYIAARVQEKRLHVRRETETAFPFWDHHDALQIVLGVRDNAIKSFSRTSPRDVNYGFLLTPFRRGPSGVEVRVLRLWSPSIPFGAPLDRVRWGGPVPGAQSAIRRDEPNKVTWYEASLPLNEIRELRPATRTPREATGLDSPIRLGWMLHRDDVAPVVWPAAGSGFAWDVDSRAFFPPGRVAPTVPTLLGWTQTGKLASDAQVKTRSPLRRKPPLTAQNGSLTSTRRLPARPPRVDPPSPQATPPTTSRAESRDSSGAPEVLPMPVRILPPAATPEGQILPPQSP